MFDEQTMHGRGRERHAGSWLPRQINKRLTFEAGCQMGCHALIVIALSTAAKSRPLFRL